MEENNVAPQEPVSNDTPVQESTPAPEPQVQETQTEQTNTEPLENSQTETVAEPTQEAAPVQEESYPSYDITQFLQQPTQAPDFTPNEDGFIDPKDFYNRLMADAEARIEQKLRFQEMERKAWHSVENKFPEIKEDPELRDLLNAQRIADVASGGKGDLNKIAEKLVGKIQSYQAKGKVQAQVSEKVQKSAALESNTANTVSTNKSADLMERMSRGDQNARNQLVSEWLAEGKI